MTVASNGCGAGSGTRPSATRLRLGLAALGFAALLAGCNSSADDITGGTTSTSSDDRPVSPAPAASTSAAPVSRGTGAGTGGWGEAGGAVGSAADRAGRGGTVGTGG
jgi:hypothetical protein